MEGTNEGTMEGYVDGREVGDLDNCTSKAYKELSPDSAYRVLFVESATDENILELVAYFHFKLPEGYKAYT